MIASPYSIGHRGSSSGLHVCKTRSLQKGETTMSFKTQFAAPLAMAALLVGGMALTRNASAQSDSCAQSGFAECSLNGAYGFEYTGLVAFKSTPGRIDDYNPLAAAGIWTFHGDGTFDATDTITLNGNVVSRQYSGTYSINPDGTGSAQFTAAGLTHARNLVIVSQGGKVEFIQTEPGYLVVGTMIKQ
jgi:hypothetical protein